MPAKFGYPRALVTVTPWSALSITGQILGGSIPSTGPWIASNRAIFVPFNLYYETPVYSLFCVNGSAISGNLDIGIYDVSGTKIVSTGSTAQAGLHRMQNITVTTTVLGAGLFYLAMVMNNTTGMTLRRTPNANECREMGMYQMASAFPLPATATFAEVFTGYLPMMGFKAYNNA